MERVDGPSAALGTERCPVRCVRAGDVITELDTPDGPWYAVVAVDPMRHLPTVQDDGYDVELPVENWDTDGVLRRPRAAAHGTAAGSVL